MIIIVIYYVGNKEQRNHFIFKNDSIEFYDTFTKSNVTYQVKEHNALEGTYIASNGKETIAIKITNEYLFYTSIKESIQYKIVKKHVIKKACHN